MSNVSVIIPAYNAEPYIELCLDSALGQSLSDIEILVVDDGSADGTRAVIARKAAADARIKPIFLDQNGGVCNARNRAIDAASGTWIALLDADDTMHETRLSRLLAAAEALGADWIADDQYFIREGDETPIARLFMGEPPGAGLVDPAHLVLLDRPEYLNYGLLKPLVRRAFMRANDIRYRLGTERYEDFLFTIDCASHGAKFALLNEPLYNYSLRGGSLSSVDPVPRLKRMRELSETMRATRLKEAPSSLLRALEERERLITRSLRYYGVVEPLKRGEFAKAFGGLTHDPLIVPYLAGRLALRFCQRLSGRDPLERVLLTGRLLKSAA
jgi:succinoglycan biosynthesis protein ExoO